MDEKLAALEEWVGDLHEWAEGGYRTVTVEIKGRGGETIVSAFAYDFDCHAGKLLKIGELPPPVKELASKNLDYLRKQIAAAEAKLAAA